MSYNKKGHLIIGQQLQPVCYVNEVEATTSTRC